MMYGQGKAPRKRYYELLHPQPVDDRPAEEIAHDILARAGVEVIHTNGSI